MRGEQVRQKQQDDDDEEDDGDDGRDEDGDDGSKILGIRFIDNLFIKIESKLGF